MNRYLVFALASLCLSCATKDRNASCSGVIEFEYARTKYHRTAPCVSIETEIDGFCWIEAHVKPPCPQSSLEYGTKCYVPMASPLVCSQDGAAPTP